MTVKMIYLARRNPATTHEEFLANWRDHATLSGTFPELSAVFAGVTQCHVVQDPDLVPGASRDYDGVNLLPVHSLLDAIELWDLPAARTTMLTDELRVFSTAVRAFTVYTVESVLVDGPRTRHVALRFLRARPGLGGQEFVRRWSGQGASALLAAADGRIRRLVHNHVLLDRPAGYEYDGIEELWFDSAGQMRDFFADKRAQAALRLQAESLVDEACSVLLATQVGLAVPAIRRQP